MLLSAMVAGAGGARAEGESAPLASGFTAAVEADAETGWQLIVLRYQDAKAPERSLEVRVAPHAGGNLFSWKVDGEELLMQPPKLADLVDQRAGTPLMFPTVNRVRDGRMSFEGRKFSFEPNNGKNFIHGLARRRPFTIGQVEAKARLATAEAFLEWDEGQPDFDRFPIKHRLTLTYTLRKGGLAIGYKVNSRDRARLPFGFGLHPYFRIPGPREEVTISSPLSKRMEAVELLPTGKLIPVAGAHDLRRPVTLAGLALDDVYLGMTPGRPAWFRVGAERPRIKMEGSRDFTHLVVYTPPDKPFFCIENQTSSTDAHNLYAAGKKRESNLLVVPPGKSRSGEVIWTVDRR